MSSLRQHQYRAMRSKRRQLLDRPSIWFTNHRNTFRLSLRRLFDMPGPSALTIAVVAISLALPIAVNVFGTNLKHIASNWDQTAAISVFLRDEITDENARQIQATVATWPEVQQVKLVTRDEALQEFKSLGDFDTALSQLPANPFPAMLAVYPQDSIKTLPQLEQLQKKIDGLAATDFSRMDEMWVKRFQAILGLVDTLGVVVGALLSMAVLLVVGNTIRLEILNRRNEIEVMQLVGATASFIRRPFLYTGGWYGFIGAICAWLLVNLLILILQVPASRLASLYHTEYHIAGMGLKITLLMFAFSIFLALVGSWFTVNRHLSYTTPRRARRLRERHVKPKQIKGASSQSGQPRRPRPRVRQP